MADGPACSALRFLGVSGVQSRKTGADLLVNRVTLLVRFCTQKYNFMLREDAKQNPGDLGGDSGPPAYDYRC